MCPQPRPARPPVGERARRRHKPTPKGKEKIERAGGPIDPICYRARASRAASLFRAVGFHGKGRPPSPLQSSPSRRRPPCKHGNISRRLPRFRARLTNRPEFCAISRCSTLPIREKYVVVKYFSKNRIRERERERETVAKFCDAVGYFTIYDILRNWLIES